MEQTPCLYPAPPACRTVSASGHGISGPRWIVKWGDAPEAPPERREESGLLSLRLVRRTQNVKTIQLRGGPAETLRAWFGGADSLSPLGDGQSPRSLAYPQSRAGSADRREAGRGEGVTPSCTLPHSLQLTAGAILMVRRSSTGSRGVA